MNENKDGEIQIEMEKEAVIKKDIIGIWEGDRSSDKPRTRDRHQHSKQK